jgi:osmoprotectant transport system ATP-binding protein
VITELSLKIEGGLIHCLLGPSGSGKTTCLRLMNGLEQADSGQILVQGIELKSENATDLRRKLGYCQQRGGLFPHMSILDNLSVVAKRLGWGRKDCLVRAEELMTQVELEKSLLDRKPSQLSGGQQQRVAVARALFLRPQVLMMDEPFGALDPVIRESLQDVVLNLQRREGITVVVVTHDIQEAYRMADKVILLKDSRIAQVGRLEEMLLEPASKDVEDYFSSFSLALKVVDEKQKLELHQSLLMCEGEASSDHLPILDKHGRTFAEVPREAFRVV